MSELFNGLEAFGIKDAADIELFVDKSKREKEKAQAEAHANKISRVLITRKYSCKVCRNSFESWDVSTYKIRLEKSDTDLRNYFSPYDPLYYAVAICPRCGYAAHRSYFDKINIKQAELIKSKITPNFKHKIYDKELTVEDAIERYRYALLNAAVKESRNSEKALLCLQLSWLFREVADPQNEKLFRDNALKGFSFAYENEAFPIAGMDSPTLQYLIGELNRRNGNLDEALKYISKVVVSKEISSRLKDRAIDIKDMILSEKKISQR